MPTATTAQLPVYFSQAPVLNVGGGGGFGGFGGRRRRNSGRRHEHDADGRTPVSLSPWDPDARRDAPAARTCGGRGGRGGDAGARAAAAAEAVAAGVRRRRIDD